MGDKFLEDEDVQKIVTFYGNYGLKVQNEELRFILRVIHNKALMLCIAVDFPKVYVNQLMDLVYPESYIVCFSGKNDDSAMWGNYADNHRGVCFIASGKLIYYDLCPQFAPFCCILFAL